MNQLKKERDRSDYHKKWREKNPKKYAMNQMNYWKKQVKKLEQEEKKLVDV